MSLVEVLNELRKIRGKFLKDEGIYIFSKPNLYVFPEYTTSPTPVETDIVDFSAFSGPKIIILNNEQDVDVYVDIYASIVPSGPFYPVKTNIKVPANSFRFGVLRDRHTHLKLRFYSNSEASTGKFTPLILAWSI